MSDTHPNGYNFLRSLAHQLFEFEERLAMNRTTDDGDMWELHIHPMTWAGVRSDVEFMKFGTPPTSVTQAAGADRFMHYTVIPDTAMPPGFVEVRCLLGGIADGRA